MCLILGIDGGGTRTRCAVSDGKRVLGRGVSNGCNIVRLGEDTARLSIQSAIREALQNANLEPESVQAACIGVAGNAVPQVREAILRIMKDILTCPVSVVGDQDIAFEAAFGDAPGILVIAGTGSIAFGRNADGKSARAGGYGFVVSDEGSGQWVGRTAVSSCLRALDAGNTSSLLSQFLTTFGANSVGELIQAANAVPLADFSKLFPIVLAASEHGDAVATEVLKTAGQQLADLAKLVAQQLDLDREIFHLATAGGVFEHSSLVRAEFQYSVKSSYPNATVIDGATEPLLGALSLASKEETLARQPLR
ncbi:MAG TPA: BadF/BadG/BcrA/BcrD ATPase family protein [Candidatus Saccharimonadales bacterium]|nr:BadF/BadG/BcrA/BcrD ATPase family protein [Candidatus Saccharimonadales bacterium]